MNRHSTARDRSSETPAPRPNPLSRALAVAAGADALVAGWLAYTVTSVLPVRDPARIPFWVAVTCALVVFVSVSFAALRAHAGARLLRGATGVLGLPALGLGVGTAAKMLAHGGAGGHFEGNVVLVGALLAVHGAVAMAYAFTGDPRGR